jgi:hypothetical protein
VSLALGRVLSGVILVAAVSAPGASAEAQAAGNTVDTTWRSSQTGPIPVIRRISGVRAEPGPFREYYLTPSGTSIGAHRHTADMHIRVISGRQFILMGDLETARVQRFDAGKIFVIPAGAWHVEWFEEDTLVEIFGVGPMRTERPPAVQRGPAAGAPK